MNREQLQRSLRFNGKPVRVVGGQVVIPATFDPGQSAKEEEKTEEKQEGANDGPAKTC